MKKIITITILLGLVNAAIAQISVWAYGDLYYKYSTIDTTVEPNRYQQNQTNDFVANHFVIGAKYAHKDTVKGVDVTANLALQNGAYVQANYAAEPSWAKYLYDANIRVGFKKYWSVEAGVWGSGFIGQPSTLAIDNPFASFGYCSDYTPYYMTGVRGTYTKGKWFAMVGLFNGQQHIRDNNRGWGPGGQITFTGDKITFNMGIIASNEANAGMPQRWRLVVTPDITWQMTKKTKLFVGTGLTQDGVDKTQWFVWTGVQYAIIPKLKLAARGEYFHDPGNLWALEPGGNSYLLYNFSTNLDYNITDKIVVRVEGKYFGASRDVFFGKSNYTTIAAYVQFKL